MLDIFISMLNKAGCDIDYMNYSDAVVVREEARIDILENAFNSCVAKIHSLEQFTPKHDARNQIVRHFAFTEEDALFDFIQGLLTELHAIIDNNKE